MPEFKNEAEKLAYFEHKRVEGDPRSTLEQKVIAFTKWLSAFSGVEIKIERPKKKKVTVIPFVENQAKPFKSKWVSRK